MKPVRWIQKILASWVHKNMRIRIQGVKYQPKTEKKTFFLLLKPKSELLKKREIIKISSFLNGSSSFRIKISEKIKQKFDFLLKKFSKDLRIDLDPDPFFSSADPGSGSGSASELNGS